MTESFANKKVVELRVLKAARSAGIPIPPREISGEEPDFRFNTASGTLGIEVSEILRPASSNDGIVPVQEEHFHRQIMGAAEKMYYGFARAVPVHVSVYFASARGKRQDKEAMVLALAEFVRANADKANPFASAYQPEVPEGFNTITISQLLPHKDEWWWGEHGGYGPQHVYEQLDLRIAEKNSRLPTYRRNLGEGAAVWLLLYSDMTVARGMSVPHGIDERGFKYDFDHVFWFLCFGSEVVELKRAIAAAT
jgi:hypothetical protein